MVFIYMTFMTNLTRMKVKSELLDLIHILYVDFLRFGKGAEKMIVYTQKDSGRSNIFWDLEF